MAQWQWYGNALVAMANGQVDWDAGNLKIMLTQSTYTVNLDTHIYRSDIPATDEASGTGYVAGGDSLESPTVALVVDSDAPAWAPATAYQLGDIVAPTAANTHVYKCITAGTSGAAASDEPSFPTGTNDQVADNTVEWVEYGTAYIKFDAADETWSSSSITARHGEIYLNVGGVASDSPLLLYNDFGSDQTSSNGNFTVQFDATGIATIGIR